MPSSPIVLPTPNEFAQRNGYKPFPPRWERFLSELRNAIVAAQPMSGRNTAVDVHPGKGTVINIERPSVAGPAIGACCFNDGSCSMLSEADCVANGGTFHANTSCGEARCPVVVPCDLPGTGICGHAICFELQIRAAEITGNNPGDFVDIVGVGGSPSSPTMGLFVFYNNPSAGLSTWTFFTDFGSPALTIANPADGVWFPVTISLWTDGVTPKAKFNIDGNDSSTDLASVVSWDRIIVGANFSSGNINHRSIRNFFLIPNPSSAEVGFYFPPEDFDSVVGAPVITPGLMVIDTLGGIHGDGLAYGLKNLDPPYSQCGNCDTRPNPGDTVTVTISGVNSCGCVDGDPVYPGQSRNHTPTGANGTYVLSYAGDIDGPFFQFADTSVVIATEQRWSHSTDCSGDPDCCCSGIWPPDCRDSNPDCEPGGPCCCDEPDCDCSSSSCPTCNSAREFNIYLINILLHIGDDGLWSFHFTYGTPHIYENSAIGFITECLGKGFPVDSQNGCFAGFSINNFLHGGTATFTW